MDTLKQQILKLKASGVRQENIAKILHCSSGTVSYHCNPDVRDKIRNKRRANRLAKREPFLHSLLHKEMATPPSGRIDWKYAETVCFSRLIYNGYDVFIPINGGGEIDCIAIKDSVSYNIQIKSSSPVRNHVSYSLTRNSINFHHNKSKPYSHIDFFLFFDGVNVFKMDFCESLGSIVLRYKVPLNRQVANINMAMDYLF